MQHIYVFEEQICCKINWFFGMFRRLLYRDIYHILNGLVLRILSQLFFYLLQFSLFL